jgi:hypothetical protein
VGRAFPSLTTTGATTTAITTTTTTTIKHTQEGVKRLVGQDATLLAARDPLRNDRTPLILGCYYQKTRVVRFLLDQGACLFVWGLGGWGGCLWGVLGVFEGWVKVGV